MKKNLSCISYLKYSLTALFFRTEIEWHLGYCLTQQVLTKESSESTKPITKTEECESFFNFFSPPQVPDDDAKNDEYTVS